MLANMCWHILKYNGTWLINLCKYSRLLYYTSDLRVKVYATYSSIIPAVASRACHKLSPIYTRVTSLVLYINKISMSFCLSVCPQTTPREINEYRLIIHHWKRNFPGTKVIYFSNRSDQWFGRYCPKTDLSQLDILSKCAVPWLCIAAKYVKFAGKKGYIWTGPYTYI